MTVNVDVLRRAFCADEPAEPGWIQAGDRTDVRLFRREQWRPDGHGRHCDCDHCHRLALDQLPAEDP